jgi:hypothetical protein
MSESRYEYDWRFENSIHTKNRVGDITGYSAWRMNRSLSAFPDTVLYSNEMNLRYGLDNQLQYDYLFNSIPRGRRFAKKKEGLLEPYLEQVRLYYKYSTVRAREACRILTPEQKKIIKKRLELDE